MCQGHHRQHSQKEKMSPEHEPDQDFDGRDGLILLTYAKFIDFKQCMRHYHQSNTTNIMMEILWRQYFSQFLTLREAVCAWCDFFLSIPAFVGHLGSLWRLIEWGY